MDIGVGNTEILELVYFSMGLIDVISINIIRPTNAIYRIQENLVIRIYNGAVSSHCIGVISPHICFIPDEIPC